MQLRVEEILDNERRTLIVLNSDQPATVALIGRDLTCEIPLSTDAVSRNHGRLFGFESGWAYKDLKSTNGSWINGEKIPSGSVVILYDGDYLQIADVVLRVSYETKLFQDIQNRKLGWRIFAFKSDSEGVELDPKDYEGSITGKDNINFELINDEVANTQILKVLPEESLTQVTLNGQIIDTAQTLNIKDTIKCAEFTYLVVCGDLANLRTSKPTPIPPEKVVVKADLTSVSQSDMIEARDSVVVSSDRTSFIEPSRVAALKFGHAPSIVDTDENDDYYKNPELEEGILDQIRSFFLRLTDLERKIVFGAIFFFLSSILVLIILILV